jgi:hypothetical protein
VPARNRLHLILGRLDCATQIGGPTFQCESTALQRMQIGQLVDKRRRLQRRRLDALEHARVIDAAIANPSARGSEDHGERILHVV